MAATEPYFPPPPTVAKQAILVSSTADPTPQDLKMQNRRRTLDSARTATVALGVAISFVVLVVSARTLDVYNATHVGPELHLPLWPAAFDIRPTVSLVVCSTLIVLFGAATLAAGRFVSSHSNPPSQDPKKSD
jgi:hypothetical protein